MNQYPYPNIFLILEELNRINKKLDRIENMIKQNNKNEKTNYLEKDDNYYII